MKEKPKLYVIRKYIKAVSVSQAVRRDKNTPVHDCWVDDDWKKNSLTDAIGFDNGIVEQEDE